IGVAGVVHDVVLVDERAVEIGAPRAQHQVARAVEQENPDPGETDALAHQLDSALEDRVGIIEGQDLVEGREQRRQLVVLRAADDAWGRLLRPQDDRPVHPASTVHHEPRSYHCVGVGVGDAGGHAVPASVAPRYLSMASPMHAEAFRPSAVVTSTSARKAFRIASRSAGLSRSSHAIEATIAGSSAVARRTLVAWRLTA